MEQWVLPAVLAGVTLLFVAWAVLDGRRRARWLRRRVRDSFGAVPVDTGPGLATPRWYECAPGRGVRLDEQTWQDLGMDEVFARVNACGSLLGEAYLYAQLHEMCGEETLQKRRALCKMLEASPQLCFDVRLLFAKLGRRRGADPAFVLADQSAQLRAPAAYRVCAWLPLAALPLALFSAAGGAAFIAACCLNVLLYQRAKPLLEGKSESLAYLMRAVDMAGALAQRLRKENAAPQLCAALEEAAQPLRPLVSARMKLSMPRSEEADTLTEWARMLLLIPVRAYLRAARVLRAQRACAVRLCALLGEVDMACATASFRASLPHWCEPECGEVLEMDGVYHPLLTRPVVNGARFARGALFTGSNASGKSTFLKAAAVNAVLAQTVYTCAARRFALPQFAWPVVTSMAVGDDLAAGESYFVAEVLSLKRLVDLADGGGAGLCVIDEILRGTNTAERVAASAAVLRHLAASRVLCLAATHDTELPALVQPEFDNYHFCESVEDGRVHFDYLLQPGVCATRNAIALLRAMGYPPDVTQSAERGAQHFLDTGEWARVP